MRLPEINCQKTLDILDNQTLPMYILTNNRRFLGACCILYPNVLKEISKDLKDNLILLPSSIHEFIVVPASFTDNAQLLRDIVCEVNLTRFCQRKCSPIRSIIMSVKPTTYRCCYPNSPWYNSSYFPAEHLQE